MFVWFYRLYPSLLDAIIIVQPKTVTRWQRRGFRAYWRKAAAWMGPKSPAWPRSSNMSKPEST